MKLAFYKGEGRSVDKLIRWWTKGRYSHCELVFSDGLSFTADAWQNKVRFERISFNPDNWDLVEIQLDVFDENKVRRWCNWQLGKKYDWLGITFSHIIPLEIEDKNRYICSEICIDALQKVGKLKGITGYLTNPSQLASIYGLN